MIRLSAIWKSNFLVLIISLFSLTTYGQFEKQHSESTEFYGTNISENLNGLVQNRTVISGQYQLDRRTFEVGILVNEFSNMSGFVFKHRYFLNKSKQSEGFNPALHSVRPHLFYRFVYNSQMPEHHLRSPIASGDVSFQLPGNTMHTINTIEHYLGIGVEIDVLKNIYINTSVSGGLYFFKDNMDAVEVEDQLVPEASTGFVFNASTGIGFHF